MNGDISEILRKYGTSLSETRKLVKELKGVLQPGVQAPAATKFLTSDEAKQYGVDIEDDWMLKLSPSSTDERGFVPSLVSPDKWEVTENQEYVSPEGERYTEEQFKQLVSGGEGMTLQEAIEGAEFYYPAGILKSVTQGVKPNQGELDALLSWATASEENFNQLSQSIFQTGRNPQTEAIFQTLGATPEQINNFFAQQAPDITTLAKDVWNATPLTALPADSRTTFEGIKPAQIPGKIMEWLAPTKAGAGLQVVGAYLEKYVGRPWESVALGWGMLTKEVFEAAGVKYTSETAKKRLEKVDILLQEAGDKYGLGMFFAPDVSEAWKAMFEPEDKIGAGIQLAYEFLNPVYIIPIGGTAGKIANMTSKIPLIGKAARYAAAGVQAVEKGLAAPLTKPLEAGLKGFEKIGASLGEATVNQLLKDSKHLLNPLDLPTSERVVNELLRDNWMKRALQTVAKLPGGKAGIEKALGWRVLINREGQILSDVVGRGAAVNGYFRRAGINAAAAKVWELRAIEANPAKLFGFDKTAFSQKMVDGLLPEYRGLAEAGTLEHIFTQPQMYNFEGLGKLIDVIGVDGQVHKVWSSIAYVTRVHEVNTQVLNMLKKEGVPPKHLIEDWIHRVITGKEKAGELVEIKGKPSMAGRKVGAKPAYEKPRQYETMADGIAAGVRYNTNPEVSIQTYIEGAFNKVADARFEKYVEEFGETATERLAERYPEVAAAAELTKTELADAARFQSVVNRAIRGEKIPEQTLKALDRRFPELAPKFRVVLSETEPIFTTKAQELLNKYKPFLEDVDRINPLTNPKEYDLAVKKLEAFVETLSKEEARILDKTIETEALLRESAEQVELFGYPAPVSLGRSNITRKEALDAIRKEAKALTESRKAPYWKAKAEKAFRMEQVRQPGIGEGYLPQPFAGGKIYSQEFIDTFNQFFGQNKGLPGLKPIADVAGILRITKAALDFSAMAIQGLPSWGLAHSMLLFDPVTGAKLMGAWYKGLAYSVGSFFDPGMMARYIEKNSLAIQQMVSCGSSVRVIDYFAALEERTGLGGLVAKAMQKEPLKLFPRAEVSFFGGGQVVRTEFGKILSAKAIANGQEFELARFLDRITGIADLSDLPLTTRQIEQSFAWFAPNYTRACLTVLADIFRGGYTGGMARKAIGGMIGAGAAMYTGVQYSLVSMEGKSHEEAMESVLEGFGVKTDPLTGGITWKPNANFMTVKVGNYNFGFGGFWYGLLRLSGNIMAATERIKESDHIDLMTILKGGGNDFKDNPFIYWWYSRSSPLVGTGFELMSGKDFLGYPIETPTEYAKYVLTRFEPIWMEQGINWMIPGMARDNEIPEGMARTVVAPAELFGLRTFPESSWVKFYDETEKYINDTKHLPRELMEKYYSPEELPKYLDLQRQGKLEWSMLPSQLQSKLFDMFPDVFEKYQEAIADSSIRNAPFWKQYEGQQDESRSVYYNRCKDAYEQCKRGELDTREMLDKWSEAGTMRGIDLGWIKKNNPDVFDEFTKKEAKGEKDVSYYEASLAAYNQVMFTEYKDKNGDPDWDRKDKAISDYIDEWGEDVYQKCREMYAEEIGRELKEMGFDESFIKAFTQKREDVDKLGRAYWQLPWKPVYQLDEADVPAQYRGLWNEYKELDTEAEREAFLEVNPDMAKDWRSEYRLAHPEDDARLALWGYGGKLQSQAAYDLVAKWSRELNIPLGQMGLGLPPANLINNYFEYNKIEGTTERKQYRQANPAFDDWGQKAYGWKSIEEQNIMPENIYKLEQKYKALPEGKSRLIFRHENPEYEDWLVNEKGLKPVGDRWMEKETTPKKTTPKPTTKPTKESTVEQAEKLKEFIEGQTIGRQ